jgi:hypothetical protein
VGYWRKDLLLYKDKGIMELADDWAILGINPITGYPIDDWPYNYPGKKTWDEVDYEKDEFERLYSRSHWMRR